MVYKFNPIGDDIKISSLLSVYNTVCELLLFSKKNTIGFKDDMDLLGKLKVNQEGIYVKNSYFKKNPSGYIYRCINEHLNPEAETQKKICHYAYKTSIALMFESGAFKIDKITKRIEACKKWDKLRDCIMQYIQDTDDVLKKINPFDDCQIEELNKESRIDNINSFSQYMNDLYAFETITNRYLFEDVIKCALYLLSNGYDLNDYLINTLVKLIDMPSVYSKNCLLFFFLNNLKGFNGFDYFEVLNTPNVGLKFVHPKLYNEDAKYNYWIECLNTAITLFSSTIIPVFENTLFILLYKFCEKALLNDTTNAPTDKASIQPENVLETMKHKIEKFLLPKKDEYGEYKEGNKYKNQILQRNKYNICMENDNLYIPTTFVSNSDAISLDKLFDKIQATAYQRESLKKLACSFFTYMDGHTEKDRYNLDFNTFDIRSSPLNDIEQKEFISPIISNLIEAKLRSVEKSKNNLVKTTG